MGADRRRWVPCVRGHRPAALGTRGSVVLRFRTTRQRVPPRYRVGHPIPGTRRGRQLLRADPAAGRGAQPRSDLARAYSCGTQVGRQRSRGVRHGDRVHVLARRRPRDDGDPHRTRVLPLPARRPPGGDRRPVRAARAAGAGLWRPPGIPRRSGWVHRQEDHVLDRRLLGRGKSYREQGGVPRLPRSPAAGRGPRRLRARLPGVRPPSRRRDPHSQQLGGEASRRQRRSGAYARGAQLLSGDRREHGYRGPALLLRDRHRHLASAAACPAKMGGRTAGPRVPRHRHVRGDHRLHDRGDLPEPRI